MYWFGCDVAVRTYTRNVTILEEGKAGHVTSGVAVVLDE